MPPHRAVFLLSVSLCLGACGPSHFGEPASLPELTLPSGQVLRAQRRDHDEQTQRSLWRTRPGAEGEAALVEPVVDWGTWREFRTFRDDVVFARAQDWSWWRVAPGQPPTPLGCSVLEECSDPAGPFLLGVVGNEVVRFDTAGVEQARAVGETVAQDGDLLLVTRFGKLHDVYDHQLRSLLQAPLEEGPRVDDHRTWVVHLDGRSYRARDDRLLDIAGFESLTPLTYDSLTQSERVAGGWTGRRPGETTWSVWLAGHFEPVLQGLSEPAQAHALKDMVFNRGGPHAYPCLVVRLPEGKHPYRVYRIDRSGRLELLAEARAHELEHNLTSSAMSKLTLARLDSLAKRDRELEAQWKAQREAEARRRAAAEAAARDRREAYLRRLREGGFSAAEITRWEAQGVPMANFDGTTYAAHQFIVSETKVLKRYLRYEDLGPIFAIQAGGEGEWEVALKFTTDTGWKRALVGTGAQMRAVDANELYGRWVIDVAPTALVVPCGRCNGDGAETQWRSYYEYNRVTGWQPTAGKVKVGRFVPNTGGPWDRGVVFRPDNCARCCGHGVEPVRRHIADLR